ncbi:MAG: HD domain-containing protein [Anaeroplasmataceae bacterium]|nr:HD domain-containing protein [Anaeroplasmataceae bacterium]
MRTILSKQEHDYFFNEIKKIINTKHFISLKNYPHHGNISIYTHAIKVAYLSYSFSIKHHLKVNYQELIRSALLHDLYFYDWHDKNNGIHLHGLFHPAKAVKNAKSLFHISKREARHMAHHMFPLTLIPPTTKEGWIICYCDKVAAHLDYKAIKKRKKSQKNLKRKI